MFGIPIAHFLVAGSCDQGHIFKRYALTFPTTLITYIVGGFICLFANLNIHYFLIIIKSVNKSAR